MAFEFRLGDTDPGVGQAALSPAAVRGVSPIRPLTNVIQTSSSRPGQGPKFARAENIQGLPTRQDPPGPGIRTTSIRGGQGSTGSGIGNAIEAVGNKFARAIRGIKPAEAIVRPRDATIEQFGGFEFEAATRLPPPPAPTFFPTTSTTSVGNPFLKEGGFVRRKS